MFVFGFVVKRKYSSSSSTRRLLSFKLTFAYLNFALSFWDEHIFLLVITASCDHLLMQWSLLSLSLL